MKQICEASDVLFIADEVMTGWGRTGTLFACEQADVTPDIACYSKGLTGEALPLAVTLCRADIFVDRIAERPQQQISFLKESLKPRTDTRQITGIARLQIEGCNGADATNVCKARVDAEWLNCLLITATLRCACSLATAERVRVITADLLPQRLDGNSERKPFLARTGKSLVSRVVARRCLRGGFNKLNRALDSARRTLS